MFQTGNRVVTYDRNGKLDRGIVIDMMSNNIVRLQMDAGCDKYVHVNSVYRLYN